MFKIYPPPVKWDGYDKINQAQNNPKPKSTNKANITIVIIIFLIN